MISAGDEQGAADLMRRHVASTRAAALAVLASLESPAAAESPATAD